MVVLTIVTCVGGLTYFVIKLLEIANYANQRKTYHVNPAKPIANNAKLSS